MLKLLLFVCLVTIAFNKGDALLCSITNIFSTTGQYNVGSQTINGFCNEYAVGPVSRVENFLIRFSKVGITCSNGDQLVVYNEDRSQVYYDYCNPVKYQALTYFWTEGKYAFIRLSTTTSNRVNITFDYFTIAYNTATTTTTTKAPAADCGNPYYKPDESLLRIVGGIEVVPNSWPWHAFFTDDAFMCGASLINNQWLVTAAHCVEFVSSIVGLKVYLGAHNLIKTESTVVQRSIADVIKHPNYQGRATTWDSDIALLKMNQSVSFTNEIRPICLPNQGQNLATNGVIGFVTGWGRQSGSGSTSTVLKQTSLDILDLSVCTVSSTQPNMICAGYASGSIVHDSCGGDSGGPFVIKQSNKYVLSGVVSWGSSDCIGNGIYTKVSNFVDWINSVIASNP